MVRSMLEKWVKIYPASKESSIVGHLIPVIPQNSAISTKQFIIRVQCGSFQLLILPHKITTARHVYCKEFDFSFVFKKNGWNTIRQSLQPLDHCDYDPWHTLWLMQKRICSFHQPLISAPNRKYIYLST